MSNEVKRTQFVDMMKGLAILLVVVYHLLGPCGVKTAVSHFVDIAMVIFFLFSGYFHRTGKRSIGENLKSRAKGLLIPFFKYSLFFWAVGSVYLVASGTPVEEAFYCLRNFFGGCIWDRTIQNWFGWEYYSLGKRYLFLADFWFLLVMMLASILFFLIVDHVIKSKGKTLFAAAVLFAVTGVLRGFGISLPYTIQMVPFWTAFMLLGAFAGQYRLFENESLTGAKEMVLSVLSLAGGVVISILKAPNPDLFRGTFAENEVISMLLCILASLLFIWGLGTVFKRLEKSGARVSELAWLGSHSLLIYLYHMFFAWIISIITGFSLRYPEEADGAFIFKTVLLMAVCLLLCILRYVFADVITGKQSEDPAVWGKARTIVLSLVLAAACIASGFLGYRGMEQRWNAEVAKQQEETNARSS
jgi:fucose 4-O-acetylase-like acetyltransferase